MFTIFHLLELFGASLGLVTGASLGHERFGWVGGVAGAVIGLFAGLILGRLPFVIGFVVLRGNLKRCDVATLRSRLDSQYFISHLIIAELVVRGEPVESFRDYVFGLVHSDCLDRQAFGEHNRRLWFPDAEQPSGGSSGSAPTGPRQDREPRC